MKDYFYRPPINKLSLTFLERSLESAYRISYQEEVCVSVYSSVCMYAYVCVWHNAACIHECARIRVCLFVFDRICISCELNIVRALVLTVVQ